MPAEIGNNPSRKKVFCFKRADSVGMVYKNIKKHPMKNIRSLYDEKKGTLTLFSLKKNSKTGAKKREKRKIYTRLLISACGSDSITSVGKKAETSKTRDKRKSFLFFPKYLFTI